jgi:hypothetical protein
MFWKIRSPVSRVQASKVRPAQIKTWIYFLGIEARLRSEIIGNLVASQELPGAEETQAGHFHHIPNFGCMARGAMRLAATGLR